MKKIKYLTAIILIVSITCFALKVSEACCEYCWDNMRWDDHCSSGHCRYSRLYVEIGCCHGTSGSSDSCITKTKNITTNERYTLLDVVWDDYCVNDYCKDNESTPGCPATPDCTNSQANHNYYPCCDLNILSLSYFSASNKVCDNQDAC